jgi:adenine-specific DNA-methyltransferase
MTNSKLPQSIFDSISDNAGKLAQIFPSSVKDGEVDFSALKEELGNFSEAKIEKYELTWAGKQNAKKIAFEDIVGKTLKYIEADSKNPESTENLYIEGDNLEVLKLLRQNYYGAIKMIYIDPPYNIGNDFVYNDNFNDSKELSDEAEGEVVEGERLIVNQKSSNRFHANWLNMMYPRLKVAKDLLTDDGVIFISIDDNEQDNLKKICSEIFGENNFLAQIIWERAFSPVNLKKHFSESHDYILCYAKNSELIECNGLPRNEGTDSRYSNPDNDQRGPWTSGDLSVGPVIYTKVYEIITPSGRRVLPPSGYCWRLDEKTFDKYVQDNRIWFGDNGDNVPRIKRFLSEVKQGITPMTIWKHSEVGHSQNAAQKLKRLFDGQALFEYPKSVELIKRCIQLYSSKDCFVLDFFSGSATTAHAVMQLNAEDGGNRKFIMVQLPEVIDEKSEAAKAGYYTICEIGKERIRRAGEKIKAEVEGGQIEMGDEPKLVPDIGFKVFQVSDSNIRWTNEAIKNSQLDIDEQMLSQKDKLDFMPHFSDIDVVYEIMLRQRDIPLSAKVKKLKGVGERCYVFADSYLVCLDEFISPQLVEGLAGIEPTPIKYIFRDSAFEDNISLKDETIRRLHAYVSRNTAETSKTYTVEFI